MVSNTTFGVDLALVKMCAGVKGRYVDIGCWKPIEYSNTKGLYDHGWSGVCIDPNREFDDDWAKERPRDLKSHYAVGGKKEEKDFYFHDYSMSNGFSKSILGNLVRKEKVNVLTLKDIFEDIGTPHVLSIDTEGSEIEVLESNDWELYRPDFIAIEEFDFATHKKVPEIEKYLNSKGYIKMFDYWTDCIYAEEKTYRFHIHE